MKLKYDAPLSNLALKFNFCRYAKDLFNMCCDLKAGRCKLTVSKPVLKAPMVSALETMI